MRVPTVIISPVAKKGLVDHTIYDTTAILKLIETRFHLIERRLAHWHNR